MRDLNADSGFLRGRVCSEATPGEEAWGGASTTATKTPNTQDECGQ